MPEDRIIKLENVDIHHQQHPVLTGINLHIDKGEFVYLIGRTGEGKSSLLKTLYGELPLVKGSAQVAGFDLSKLNAHTRPKLRRKLGIVFQDFSLLGDRSVKENLMFVLGATGWQDKHKIGQRIEEVLEWVELSDAINRMPHQISGGERQRIVIARALLNQPEVILADEPTGNLDPETSENIMRLIRQLSQDHNIAVVFATHEYRFLEQFPARIWRCHAGHVFEEEEFRL